MLKSKFNLHIPYWLLIASVCSYLFSLFLLQLFLGILSILWILEKNEYKKRTFDYFGLLVLLFGLMRAVSVLLSLYPGDSVHTFYKEGLFYLGFFTFNFYLKLFDENKFALVIMYFTASAAAAALTGILLFNFGLVHRAQSFTSGYMTYSTYLLCTLGAALGIITLADKKFNPWYGTIAIILILSGIITSLGRANIAIAGAVFLAAIILKKINLPRAFIIILCTAVISYLSFLNNQQEITQRIDQPAGLSDRDVIYKAAGEILFERPVFGFGPRTFQRIFLYRDMLGDKGIGSWHNDTLQVYIEGGIVTLAAFLMMIFIPLWKGTIILRKKILKDDMQNILPGLLIAITTLFLSSLTSGFITSPVLSLVFAFLLAALARIVYNESFKEISNT